MWIKLVFILLIASTAWAERVPIGFSKWRYSENVESFALGSQPQNYQTDDGWDVIDNNFIVDADSAYCHTAILKITVGNNGRSTVRLKWNDVTYEITRQPKKIVWLNSQTKNWIDIIPNLTWPTPTIGSNTVTWGFPGFSYSIIKETVKISHRFTFMDAFLDSAITLYNQRADSQYIFLGTVMEYSFVNIDDSTLLDIPEVDFKRLKTLGKAIFDISKQHVKYDGWESYDLIPVRQRWVKQGGKIYCIEGMKMQKIKELTEAFPDIPIWHDAQDSFSIDSTGAVIVKCAELYSFSGGNDNYGAKTTFQVGQQTSSRFLRAPFQFTTLVDSLRTYEAGVDIVDSGLVNIVIQSAAALDPGSPDNDTLGISINRMTALWDEGDQTGTNNGAGARWDSASAVGTGGGGNNPNAPLDWTNGGDFEADPEDDTTYLAGGVAAANDTITMKITGTSLVADTTNPYGWMIFPAYIHDGDDGGSGASVQFHSDDAASAVNQLYLNVFLTTGAAPPTPTPWLDDIHSIDGAGKVHDISDTTRIHHP